MKIELISLFGCFLSFMGALLLAYSMGPTPEASIENDLGIRKYFVLFQRPQCFKIGVRLVVAGFLATFLAELVSILGPSTILSKKGVTMECTKDGGRKVIFINLPEQCTYVEELDSGGIKAKQLQSAACNGMIGAYSLSRGCKEIF